jgi:phosphoglycolate phosphatase
LPEKSKNIHQLQPHKTFDSVRALVFDLDGTLIDSKIDLANAVNATLAFMGRCELAHADIFALVGNGAAALVRSALGPGTTDEETAKGLEFFLAYYRAHMLDNTVLYGGVRECLESLREWKLSILTNKPVRFSRDILIGLGIAPYFAFVYGGNSFEKKKPDPTGLFTLLKDFELQPEEAMVVGDSVVDVQTARNAGTWVCGVTYGLGSEKLPSANPDLLLDNLADLPKYLPAQ